MISDDLIKKTVYSLVERGDMFTSLDVSQAIKKSGTFVRNLYCRNWLRANFQDLVNEKRDGSIFSDPNLPDKFADYELELIPVRGGTEHATLYRPYYSDPKDYKSCDQVPLTNSEVEKIKKIKKSPVISGGRSVAYSPTLVVTCTKKATPDIKDILDGDTDIVSRSISSVERIKIPGAIVKKLGWGPGTVIDPDKAKLIKTDKPIPAGLKINKDLRLSIPRGIVAVPNPVRVRCDGYIITFEKADKQ